MSKIISIAVGDRIKIDGVGEVELVVVSPEQKQTATHPLLGKWVRATTYDSAEKVEKGKWYPVVDYDEKEGLYINTGGRHDNLAWKIPSEHFDLDNPCDFNPNMPEAINPKYKVGDEVVVLDYNYVCRGYQKSFWFLGLEDKNDPDHFKNGTKAKIFGLCRHGYFESNIYAICDENGNECVISEDGIQLATQIAKQEWLNAASRLFDSWMKIGGETVLNSEHDRYSPFYSFNDKGIKINLWRACKEFPFAFQTEAQAEQFLSENEADLKTFFHVRP